MASKRSESKLRVTRPIRDHRTVRTSVLLVAIFGPAINKPSLSFAKHGTRGRIWSNAYELLRGNLWIADLGGQCVNSRLAYAVLSAGYSDGVDAESGLVSRRI